MGFELMSELNTIHLAFCNVGVQRIKSSSTCRICAGDKHCTLLPRAGRSLFSSHRQSHLSGIPFLGSREALLEKITPRQFFSQTTYLFFLSCSTYSLSSLCSSVKGSDAQLNISSKMGRYFTSVNVDPVCVSYGFTSSRYSLAHNVSLPRCYCGECDGYVETFNDRAGVHGNA